MMPKVISLRPLKDFYDLDVYPSKDITVMELGASSTLLKQEILKSDGIILPAVGSKLDSSLFEGSKIKLIQVTGAGFDRLNVAELSALGIPVANIPGDQQVPCLNMLCQLLYLYYETLTIVRRA